mgnify:FL=1
MSGVEIFELVTKLLTLAIQLSVLIPMVLTSLHDRMLEKLADQLNDLFASMKDNDLPENCSVYVDKHYKCSKWFSRAFNFQIKVLYKPNDDKLKEYLYFDSETARICTVYQIRKARKRLTNVDAFDYCKFASEQYTNEILQNI